MSSGHHVFCWSKGFSYRDFCTLLLKYLSHNILNTLCSSKSCYTATAFTVSTGDRWVGAAGYGWSAGLYSVILNAYRLPNSLRWGMLVRGFKASSFEKSLVRFSSFHFLILWNQKGKHSCFLPAQPLPCLTCWTNSCLCSALPQSAPHTLHQKLLQWEGYAVLLLVSQHIM